GSSPGPRSWRQRRRPPRTAARVLAERRWVRPRRLRRSAGAARMRNDGVLGRRRWTSERRRKHPRGDGTVSGTGSGGGDGWSEREHALLDAALEFYGAAEAVIDYGGVDRPRLRYDVGGLQAVRDAMASLEADIRAAHDAGASSEQIASITRLDPEIVEL